MPDFSCDVDVISAVTLITSKSQQWCSSDVYSVWTKFTRFVF